MDYGQYLGKSQNLDMGIWRNSGSKGRKWASPYVSVISTTSVVEKTAKLSETLGHTERNSVYFLQNLQIY